MGALISKQYLQSTLADVSYTEDHNNNPQKQFILGSIGEICVCGLDRCHMNVSEIWRIYCSKKGCSYRSKGYFTKDFCTVDALYETSTEPRSLYFIEFKAQPSTNVEEGDIWAKAFESPYAAALGPLEGWTMEEIRRCSEFVLVVKNITDKTRGYYNTGKDFNRISDPILKWAGRKDGENKSIYFGLEQFREKELYRDVHTFSEEQFIAWAKEHLR